MKEKREVNEKKLPNELSRCVGLDQVGAWRLLCIIIGNHSLPRKVLEWSPATYSRLLEYDVSTTSVPDRGSYNDQLTFQLYKR